MIGSVVSSTQKNCLVVFHPDVIPRVGEWVQVGGTQAIVEKVYYNQRFSPARPCGQLGIYNTEDVWAPPVKPGAEVEYMNKFTQDQGMVCGGYFQSGGKIFPLKLDLDYLIGLSGSHVHIGSISGQGKTSFLMWLIRNIMHQTKEEGPSTAAFIVNLKFSDLMNLHKPSELSEKEKKVYADLDLPTDPFENISYFASNGSNSLSRSDVKPFGYSIDNGLHLLQRIVWELDDKSKTLEALIEALKTGRMYEPEEFGYYGNWKSLWLEPPLAEVSAQPNSWKSFHLSTVRRFLRQSKMILEDQNSGLFVNDPTSKMDTIESIVKGIRANETRVLDFSDMSTTEKFVSMHELVETIFKECTKAKRTIPERIILFVDELNAYAPRSGKHPLKKLLLEISERGRSLGISLVSAAQFSSHVHPRITGNCSTKIVGRLAASEMMKPDYRYLPEEQRSWLSMMPKGELIIDHAPLGKPVKVSFPRPPFHVGQ